MRGSWFLLLALTYGAQAQFHMEGFTESEHLNAHLFDHGAYGSKDVLVHVHRGSYVEEPIPPEHSRIQLKWLNDTAVPLTLEATGRYPARRQAGMDDA